MVPCSFPFHDPDQLRGELPPGEAGTLVGFRVRCHIGVLEAVLPVTTHNANVRLRWVSGKGRRFRRPPRWVWIRADARRRTVLAGRAACWGEIRGYWGHRQADGELDHSTAERFVACIFEVLGTKPRSITVDAHGVMYTDSSGLAALLHAYGLAFVDQVDFRIRDPSPRLRRLVEVSGTKDLLLSDD